MPQTFMRSLSFLALGTMASVALAQTPAAPAKPADAKAAPKAPASADPRAALIKKFDGVTLEDLRISPVKDVYELAHGTEITYITGDGKYAFVGDMVDVDSNVNVTENRRRGIRARMIDSIPESEMLVYSPKEPAKYTITVFTDIDCGYCRKLHSQIAEYNKLGIRVRYLFFPRSGPNTESWSKAEAVWCSANRNDALTRAKGGETVKAPKCPSNAVARDFDLGLKLKVDGTPAIFLASGEMLGGYSPPNELARYLKTGKM